ncbi:hypothetical protein SAMN05216262_10393 [Colwellia chukchiensis]|uniref:Uncharacterized protein n=1 Tax=Colwellia chukchiensis TaxID=641665 RepID=A0A1H7KCX5_9GAMM|nr:hypothetical protein [Colwellia chukchiensis]SEK84394.1 hypothetical protein SAMN05216262_10393 [Colwellia chukchiensis]
MDIFTTALTRVVPVPIKPAELKVKALAKSAAEQGVSDDVQGLEDHEYYYQKSSDQDSSRQSKQQAEKQQSDNSDLDANAKINQQNKQDTDPSADVISKDKDGKPHLDIYV